MRITELLEGKNFDDLQFVKHKEDGGREVDFDVPDDLIFFMKNDDDVFRRIVYPSIAKCVDRIDANQKTNPSLFTHAVRESYKQYINKYPIRELPDSIDDETCNETCKKMHEEICKNHSEGKYKD
jgi:hypothetical protein